VGRLPMALRMRWVPRGEGGSWGGEGGEAGAGGWRTERAPLTLEQWARGGGEAEHRMRDSPHNTGVKTELDDAASGSAGAGGAMSGQTMVEIAAGHTGPCAEAAGSAETEDGANGVLLAEAAAHC